MKAMVLAAGIGSRLRPLTDRVPKALLEVGGVPMLERVLRRLAAFGVDAAVVNAFHHADQIEAFLGSKDLGLRVAVSREESLLDTGGGLKKAASFFDDGKPFFLHNVDVETDLDLDLLLREHRESGVLATVAVQDRPTSRHLLFTSEGALCGWEAGGGAVQWARGPVDGAVRLAFNGIHAVSPEIFGRMSEEGAFSILRSYLRLAGEGALVRAYRMGEDCYWKDIGSPEKLEEVRRRAAGGRAG